MKKITQGNWEVSGTTKGLNGLYIKADNQNIAQVFSSIPECEQNAKLIAASPILYNAAYSALQAIYAMPKKKQAFYKYLINDLLNAIQKANGTII